MENKKKLEIDILLRFAGTTQISEAIKNLGITQYQNFLLISIGKNQSLDKVFVPQTSKETEIIETDLNSTVDRIVEILKSEVKVF